MSKLSESYAKTIDLVERKKTEDAAREFKTGLAAMGRKIYSEVASAFPKRFEGKINSEDWGNWARQLYIKIRKVETAFATGKMEEAQPLLPGLREHFYALHEKTGTRQDNDFIHAFCQKAAGEQVEAGELATLKAALEKAPPSLKSKAMAKDYAKAKAEWAGKVEPILADGKVQSGELPALRQANDAFHKAFGMPFE